MSRKRMAASARNLALAAALALISLLPSTGRSITQSELDDAIDRAKEYQGNINTTNEHTDQMKKEAEKSYGDYQKRSEEIKKWQDRIDYKDDKIFVKDKPDQQQPAMPAGKSMLAADERIYIFISSSMPTETVMNYARDLDRLSDSRMVMVLRGCIGGCEKIMPTVQWIQGILAPTKESQLAAEVIIDPYLYSYYDVKAVPAIIYAKGVNTDMDDASEGLPINLKTKPKAYSLLGDVSLAYALEKIATESKTEKLAQIAKKIQSGQYSQ